MFLFAQCLALILITCATIPLATFGIQVHEIIANDLTTTATTLLPTPVTSSTSSAEIGEMRLTNSDEDDDDDDDNADSSEVSTAVTITLPVYRESNTEVPAASTNAAIPPTTISTTKMPRVEKAANAGVFKASHPAPAGIARDQQPRSTINVAQHTSSKQFVPSPQLSPVTFPPISSATSSSAENGRENTGGQLPLNSFQYNYPAWATQQPQFASIATALPPTQTTTLSANSKYYKPTQDNFIYNDAADREPWRLSAGPPASQAPPSSYQYPISANGGAGGRWYWMPNAANPSADTPLPFGTTMSTPFASDSAGQAPPQHWRWFVDQKFGTNNANAGPSDPSVGPSGPEAPPSMYSTVATYRPGGTDFPRIEHPYSFDPPGTVVYGMTSGGTNHNGNGHNHNGYGFMHGPGTGSGSNGGGPNGEQAGAIFGTEITENEWEHWVKGRPTAGGPGAGDLQIIPSTKEPPKGRPKKYV